MPAVSAARNLAREIWTVRLLPRLPSRSRLSPLTLRILAINVVALALLGGGLFYLGEYQQNLVYARIEALKTQGQIFAAALGEGAIDRTVANGAAPNSSMRAGICSPTAALSASRSNPSRSRNYRHRPSKAISSSAWPTPSMTTSWSGSHGAATTRST
jgi:hypothetical protein